MKLLKLEISGFGKFENKIIDLDEDFILIRGDNEAGKSLSLIHISEPTRRPG